MAGAADLAKGGAPALGSALHLAALGLQTPLSSKVPAGAASAAKVKGASVSRIVMTLCILFVSLFETAPFRDRASLRTFAQPGRPRKIF